MEKFMLSEEGYEYLTKGIAIGVGIGIFAGAFFRKYNFYICCRRVIGMISGLIYSTYKKFKRNNIEAYFALFYRYESYEQLFS